MSNDIAIRRAHQLFVVPETTKGTLVYPAAGNVIVPVGLGMINQTPSYTESEEIKNTRDITDRFTDRMPPGEWSVSCYSRPAGAGVAPQEGVLMEALFGTETIVSETSTTYSQALEKSSVSVFALYDNTLRFLAGATVSSMNVSAANAGALRLEFSGRGMKAGTVGTQLCTAISASGATTITVTDASCYSVGGKIERYRPSDSSVDHNTNTGYTISAINYETNVLTVPAIVTATAVNDVIRPWLPTVSAYVGAPVENRKTVVNIDGSPVTVKGFSITVDDPAVYLEEEITSTEYVEDYIPDTRRISGSVSRIMRQDDAADFVDNQAGREAELELVVGDTAGAIVTFNLPICSLDVPTISDSAPTVSIDMNFMALGDDGEDSMTVAYT